MSKLLFTVCAFGLFLSSAFGQEKSPEQLREERSHIFGVEGLQTQTFARFVASGAKQRMGFYAHINPDCKPSAKASIKIFVFTRIVLPARELNDRALRCSAIWFLRRRTGSV
jgi:hypothetical protein